MILLCIAKLSLSATSCSGYTYGSGMAVEGCSFIDVESTEDDAKCRAVRFSASGDPIVYESLFGGCRLTGSGTSGPAIYVSSGASLEAKNNCGSYCWARTGGFCTCDNSESKFEKNGVVHCAAKLAGALKVSRHESFKEWNITYCVSEDTSSSDGVILISDGGEGSASEILADGCNGTFIYYIGGGDDEYSIQKFTFSRCAPGTAILRVVEAGISTGSFVDNICTASQLWQITDTLSIDGDIWISLTTLPSSANLAGGGLDDIVTNKHSPQWTFQPSHFTRCRSLTYVYIPAPSPSRSHSPRPSPSMSPPPTLSMPPASFPPSAFASSIPSSAPTSGASAASPSGSLSPTFTVAWDILTRRQYAILPLGIFAMLMIMM